MFVKTERRYDRFYESIRLRELPQFPGEYEYVSYSIRQVVAELIKFTHASPSCLLYTSDAADE